VSADLLTDRQLNRATLTRQLLLERSDLDPLSAVEHLVGLQAQEPPDPYLALWSRLEGFDPHALGALLEEREVVRLVVMRGTVHLVSADDALVLRPLCQPVLDGELIRHSEFKDVLATLDLPAMTARLRPLLVEAGPLSGAEIRAVVEEQFPDLDAHGARAVAWSCRNLLDMVQTPPRGVWGKRGQVRTTPLDAWLGRPVDPSPSIDAVVLRYLAAFGPSSVADIASWSRLTGMREIVDRLGPQLRPFRNEAGRELWDLPDAPRPDPDVPAPTRFLPEYDNVLLSHADRGRFGGGPGFEIPPPVKGAVLVDGTGRGVWHPVDDGLVVRTFGTLSKRVTASIAAEGRRVLRFLGAGGTNVRVMPLE
jgi:Winged helix DNA-binding domain